MFQKLKGWRTAVFNGSLIAFGTFTELVNFLDVAPLEQYFNGKWAFVTIAIGAVNIILRARTTTPIGKK